jgi:signal transduction histidine kinase
MRRRILAAILSVTAVAILLFGVPLAMVVVQFVNEEATLRVERQAVLASRQVPADFATSNDPVELPQNRNDIVLALYDLDGSRVAGIGPLHADPPTLQALDNDVVDSEVGAVRVVAVPVAADEHVVGVIRAEQPTAATAARSRRILALLAGLAVGVLAVGAAIGYVLAGRLARPVRRLRDAAVQLGDGDFALDVPRSSVPELDEAGIAVTATARRLDDLVSRERSFSADASHQLRTPISGLRAAIETELEFPRADPTDVLHEALSDLDRLERTISELLSIARTSTVPAAAVSLADVFDELEELWCQRVANAGRHLTIAPARYAPTVMGNSATLRHALDVLLDNALQHGSGEIRVDNTFSDEAVTITVTDEGSGFMPESPKPDGSVHGLGLPLARRLIESMPGRLRIVEAGTNSRIDIVLQRQS